MLLVPYKIPCAKRDKLKTAFDKMTQSGVIADANGPTDWVSNLVITEKKSGALRNYLDPKPLNPVIKREHLIIPNRKKYKPSWPVRRYSQCLT